jgi:hypothetical protein
MTFLKPIHGIDQKHASWALLEVILSSAILPRPNSIGLYVIITVNWLFWVALNFHFVSTFKVDIKDYSTRSSYDLAICIFSCFELVLRFLATR